MSKVTLLRYGTHLKLYEIYIILFFKLFYCEKLRLLNIEIGYLFKIPIYFGLSCKHKTHNSHFLFQKLTFELAKINHALITNFSESILQFQSQNCDYKKLSAV